LTEFGSLQIDGIKIPIHIGLVKNISTESQDYNYRPVFSSELYGILRSSRNYLTSIVFYEAGDRNYFDICYINWEMNGEVEHFALTKYESHRLFDFYCNMIKTTIDWKEYGF